MNIPKYIFFMVIIILINGYITVKFINKNNYIYKTHYKQQLLAQNSRLYHNDDLCLFYNEGIKVDVTMYHPIYPQTDNTPNITADGTIFDITQASKYRYVALSRNLLSRWGGTFDYGDFILITGTKQKDGVYQVRDTMSSKWVNVVDILETEHVKPYKFTEANLFKITWTK